MKTIKYILFKFLFLLSPVLFSTFNPDLSSEQRKKMTDFETIRQKKILRQLSGLSH